MPFSMGIPHQGCYHKSMKSIFISVLLFSSFSSLAAEKQYESYEQIVNRLSRERSDQLRTQVSTTLPQEHFHVMLGGVNNSSSYRLNNLGTVNSQGLMLGLAVPLIAQQLYVEGLAKFFKNQNVSENEVSLHQFEARIAHKEPMNFALLNLGAGLSTRFLDAQDSSGNRVQYNTPNFMFLIGLERRITSSMSVAGDVSYHRSLREQDDGKNVIDLAIRLNYHL